MKVIKTCIILLFFCAFSIANAATSFSQEKTISLKAKDYTLKELCSEIEKNSDYRFVFSGDVSKKMSNSLHFDNTNGTVEEILRILSSKAAVNYNIYGKQIVLFDAPKEKATPPAEQTPPPAKKELVTLKGKVVDEDGETLPGVSVHIPASTIGTVTDIDGNFELQLPFGETMVICFDYVGMQHFEYIFKGIAETVDIMLKNDKEMLDEVVVIGYGSKDRKSLTSSISSMKNKDVERLAATVPSVDALLGGAVKGVFSTQKSGAPGEGMVINVRGITSPIASASFAQSNAPLYVIDGMPYFVDDSKLNPLLVISPNDIESVDVLKDASATAIYGSRGANGVVIVKTKNGRKGEKITLDAGYTFSAANPVKEHKPLNIAEFKQLQDEIIRGTVVYNTKEMTSDVFSALSLFGKMTGEVDPNTGMYKKISYNGLNESAFGKNFTNWNNEVTNKNAAAHQYYVSLRGGSETTNYSASINALNQEGIMINDDFSRYGMRLSIDTDINPRVRTGTSLSYSVSSRKYGGASHEAYASDPSWRMRPDVPVYDEQGEFVRYRNTAYSPSEVLSPNPVAKRSQKNKFGSQQFMGNGYIEVNIMSGLRARAEMNVSSFAFKTIAFTPTHSENISNGMPSPSSIRESNEASTHASLNLRLDYTKKLGEHNFAAMAGVGSERSYRESRSSEAEDFFNGSVLNNIGSANTYYPVKDGYGKGGLNSAYSRLSYDFAYRYLAEMSLRGDVSSKFGPENRLAIFPAVSLGWRINQESFMEDKTWIDDLKLRLSWGKTGSTNVDDFSYLRYYSKLGKYGGKAVVGAERVFPNREVGWEKTSEYNGGLDFSFFNHRLFGSIDIYNRVTKGALSSAPFVMETGYTTFQSNLIDMVNKGFELEIGSEIIRSDIFSWTSSLNVSSNKNRVIKLNGANLSRTYQDYIMEGQPIGVIKGFSVKEIAIDQKTIDAVNEVAKKRGHTQYQSDLGIGDYLIEDTNNDGKITTDDRVVLASPLPDLFGGWNNVFRYKNLELSCLMQFSLGGKANYSDVAEDLSSNIGVNVTRETFSRTWTPENNNAIYPRLVFRRYYNYNIRPNNRSVFDRSYLRMKNVTLSYDLSKEMVSAMGMTGVSVFTSITNLFTITKWPGLDPELVGESIFAGDSKKDPYPLSRTVSIGFRIRL